MKYSQNPFSEAYKKSNSAYTYITAEGRKETITAGVDGVTEDWIAQVKAWHREERSMLRHGENKLISLDGFDEYAEEYCSIFIDPLVDVEGDLINKMDQEEFVFKLHEALEHLTQRQRNLFYSVRVQKQSISSIAKFENVDESSIRERIYRIEKKLKKFL